MRQPMQFLHDSRSVHDPALACRVRQFHNFDLRSPHYSCGRGSPTSHSRTTHLLKSFRRCGISGAHRRPFVGYFTNGSGPVANTCPKITYLFLTVSARNPLFNLRLTEHSPEPLFDPPGVHRKYIWFVFLTIQSACFSHLAAAYLSDWNREVSAIH